MQVILLVVVGAINQSKYVPMMSLAVVGTLTNQILLVYVGLCRGLCGSMWVYMGVYAGLHGDLHGSKQVYAGLCGGLRGSMWGSMQVYAELGNIIQSKSVPVMLLSVVRSISQSNCI